MKKQSFESVWDVLEKSPEASAGMQVRAALMIEMQCYVNKSGLTQHQAAKRLGITQPRLNDLLRGEDRQVQCGRAGKHVGESR